MQQSNSTPIIAGVDSYSPRPVNSMHSMEPASVAPPPPPSLVYTRADEYRLNDLQRRLDFAEGAPLTAAEQQEYLQLAAKRQSFEEEGARALLAGRTPDMERSTTFSDNVGTTFSAVAKGTLFWSSLVVTAAPGYVGRKLGLTDQFTHWNWITESLILGALPVVTKVGTSGDHLQQIAKHCDQRGKRIALVVSALTKPEMDGFGISFPRFARHDDWRRELQVASFELLEIDDMTATGADYVAMRRTVEHMQRVAAEPASAIYVHCKAGKGRSWMVVVCYLTTQCHMEFEAACALVRKMRHQVSPSRSQIRFAQDFTHQYNAGNIASRMYNEPRHDSASGVQTNGLPPQSEAVLASPNGMPTTRRLDAIAGAQAADGDDWVDCPQPGRCPTATAAAASDNPYGV